MPHPEIQEILERSADGNGYGDPDARSNDDRRLQILLAQEQQRIGTKLNRLTLFLVIVGFLNVLVLMVQVLKN